MSRPSEDGLIARFFAPLAGAAALGLRDDAGLLAVAPGHDLVLTKDAVVAGVHFFPDDPPDAIARKALRVNLSDLAAKRARPIGFLLAIMLPDDWTEDWLQPFARGLGEDAALFGCPLIGGDTVATPGPLCLSITALGEVPARSMLPRTTVRAGDALYLSGTVGDAALGLHVRRHDRSRAEPASTALAAAPWIEALAEADRLHLMDRYLHPRPRLALLDALRHAGAGMDVSDGLIGDLGKMLRVSGVSARIDLRRLPLSEAARAALKADPSLLGTIVTGGDDYELLVAVAEPARQAFEAEAAACGVDVTMIGRAVQGAEPLSLTGRDGAPIRFENGSYSHY